MTESDALPRETGAAKAGRPCPSCGGPMQLTESAYGSVVAVCPACSAAKVETQTASFDEELPREKGTPDDA